MPQSERSIIFKKILRWMLEQCLISEGVTTQAIITYTIEEICEMGATEKTVKDYIEYLGRSLMIEYKHPYWRITEKGKDWLERHP